jgi:hypothetical protein
VDFVVEILVQLSEQAGLDQGHRRGLDALLHLKSRGVSLSLSTASVDCSFLPVRH